MGSDREWSDADRYEAWYAEKLWALLPPVYRAEDPLEDGTTGPLRELVERIAVQAAIVRRSIDRLWEDQSIETCDDWVIPYIGDLLSTNLVASLDAPGKRVDVKKTIYYRRRKGTVALLEELGSDITGWRVRVVEFFRRLGRTRHNLDPAIGDRVATSTQADSLQRAKGLVGERTRTPAGGRADLRNAHGAELAKSAFDEFFYTADVRRGKGRDGWYGIPRIGVFVWRLRSTGTTEIPPVKDEYGLDVYTPLVTPVQDTTNPNQYTFDPTGREIPLFAANEGTLADRWVPPLPHEIPGPITRELLGAAWDDLYGAKDASLCVFRESGSQHILIPLIGAPELPPKIDPECGRFVWDTEQTGNTYRVHYHYGFSSDIGAGFYDRRPFPQASESALAQQVVEGGTGLDAALQGIGATSRVEIKDSLTYDAVADVADMGTLELVADNGRRPLVRLPAPGTPWILHSKERGKLLIDGLFVSGGDLVLQGSFERVQLRCCTFDPGTWSTDPATPTWAKAADGRALRPTHLRIEGTVECLEIDRCVTAPILVKASDTTKTRVESLHVRDSIVQAADPRPGANAQAIVSRSGETHLSRCTILGPARLHRLHASECILHDLVEVADYQQGCVRFSAWARGSKVPRPYESQEISARTELFVSRAFGDPRFAQLLPGVTTDISEGAEDGSEMGAFAREKNVIKQRSLLIKYQEYLPVGLEPVIIHAT